MAAKVGPLGWCSCGHATRSDAQRRETSHPKAVSYAHDACEDEGDSEYYDEDASFFSANETALLRVKVRTLEKYKVNYDLLCSQLGELNSQIGMQLQRHESDVAALNDAVAQLQSDKQHLEQALAMRTAELSAERLVVKQDREYAERVHRQLSTAADVLKATEKRLESTETQLQSEIEALKRQLSHRDEQNEALQAQLCQQEAARVASKEREKICGNAVERCRETANEQIVALQDQLHSVAHKLEAQRSAHRHLKRQCHQQQLEKDALATQLGRARDEATHLAVVLESQSRSEQHESSQDCLRWKKKLRHAQRALQSSCQEISSLQRQLSRLQEELVDKNAMLERVQIELRITRQQQQQRTTEVKPVAAQEVAKSEQEDHERQARWYRKEMQRMRQLLTATHARTSASSHEMAQLKQELLGVQTMLHKCQVGVPVEPPAKQDTRGKDNQQHEREIPRCILESERVSVARAEEVVLKSAIMDQVRALTS